jgi:hypothetical protein
MADAALGSFGSDLAFSVSFALSTEALDAAREAQLSEDELVGIVIALSVIFSALPRSALLVIKEVERLRGRGKPAEKKESVKESSGLAAFMTLLVGIAQRVCVSVAVQLLATNVRTKQPLRSVRIVSLLSVVVFFVFISGLRHR